MDEHKFEIEELQRRAFDLGSKITSTDHQPTKKSLIAEKAAIDLKLEHLRRHRTIEEEKQYSEKLETLIKENRLFISFSVNNQRINIDEKGKVQVTFTSCNHRKSFPITELRLSQVENNRTKFERWVRILKTNITYTGEMRCRECQKNKEQRFQRLRRRTKEPTPKIRWELRALR